MQRKGFATIACWLVVTLVFAPLPISSGAPTAKAPIIFDGDDAFRGPLARALGVTGSGTSVDPFVISGLSIPVPVTPSPLLKANTPGLITIQNSQVHVRIVDNEFYAIEAHGPTGGESPPAIVIVGAENVAIEENIFRGIGGSLGAVSIHESMAVSVARNTFEAAHVIALNVQQSAASITDNEIGLDSETGWMGMTVWNPQAGSLVSGNLVDAQGSDGIGIHVFTEFEAITIEDNVVRGTHDYGLAFVAKLAVPPSLIRGNAIEGTLCARIDGPARLEANAFTGCGFGLSASFADVGPNNTVNGLMMLGVRDTAKVVIDGTHPRLGWLRLVNVREVQIKNHHNWMKLASAHIEGSDTVVIDNVTMSVHEGLFIEADTVRITNALLGATQYIVNGGLRVESRVLEADRVRSSGPVAGLDWRAKGDGEATLTRSTFTGTLRGLMIAANLNCERLAISDSTLKGGASAFLQCDASTIRNSSILGPLTALSPGGVVDARHNWWGHATGPSTAANPGGLGSHVNGPVLFDPWLTSTP